MEAFPAIVLLSDDPVLAEAIPAQLLHGGNGNTKTVADWDGLQQAIMPTPPALAIIDCAICATQLADLADLRQAHPLMAVIGIGDSGQAAHFVSLPLSAFIKRPVAMQVFLRSAEHLRYERSLTAGQQVLPLAPHINLHPAEKSIRHAKGALELTDKEVAMLLCLYHHRHGWLPRQQLLEEVWGYNDAVTTHTLETHLYRLRGKLREVFGEEERIVTQQGAYQLKLA